MLLALHYWMGDAHHCSGTPVSEMTYTMSSGTLNPTILLLLLRVIGAAETVLKKHWRYQNTKRCGMLFRYMMLIDGVNSVYMIDRDNAIYCVPKMVFPKRKDLSVNLTNTLLDGVSSSVEMECSYFFIVHCTNIFNLLVSIFQSLSNCTNFKIFAQLFLINIFSQAISCLIIGK